MKMNTPYLQVVMTVVLAVIFSIGCDPASVTDGEEQPLPAETLLYITDPNGGWTEGRSINIGGGIYPLSFVDDSTAKTSIAAGAENIFLAYPPEAIFDSKDNSYTFRLSSEQEYGSSLGTFIAAACSYRSGDFPFRTATLNGVAGYVSVDVWTTGSARPSWVSISASDTQRNCAGLISQDCISGRWSLKEGEREVRLSLPPSMPLPTMEKNPLRITFAVLPAVYKDGFVITFEGGRQAKIGRDIEVKSGLTEHLGCIHIEPDSGLTQLSIAKDVPLGTPQWQEGTRLSINGMVAEASGTVGGTLAVPFSRADSYSAVYPVADSYSSDGKYTMHIPILQDYAQKAPQSDPILCAFGGSTGILAMEQVSGVIRIKIHTVPGPVRLLKSVRLTGDGVAATFEIDPSTGAVTRTGSCPDGITVDFGPTHLIESSDPSAPTSFSFVVLPGDYSGLELEVTARDATCKIPEGLQEDDLWSTTKYKVPPINVRAGVSTIVDLEPQVVEYDWIRQNGVCYTGTKDLSQCTAAFIDTGWLVPQGSGHSVSYMCTMSGSLPANESDLRQERVLFGSQGSGSEKPVFFVFNENASARRWYATMANLAGRDTYKQETSAQKYGMAADLDGLRSIIIGTDGIKNSSYIYMRLRRDDLGATAWTDLHPRTDYFKFKSGSLKNAFPVYLFCKNVSGRIGSPCPHIRIHRFTVTYDGTVQKDLTPCMVDGIPGMMDNAHPGTYFFNPNPYAETVVKNGCLTAFEVGNNSDIR